MKKIEDILALCIEDIKAGRSTPESCLDQYSSIRQELEPLLRIALSIQEPPLFKPSDAFRVRTRVQLMEQIHPKRSEKKSRRSVYGYSMRQIWYAGWLKTVALVIAFALAVPALGTGIAYASQDSLPGETLYPVKIGTEQVRRLLTIDDISVVELEVTFASTRLQEIEALSNKAPDQVTIAMKRYEKNIAMAIEKAEQIGDSVVSASVLEMVALAISRHISILDTIEDSVPEAAKEAVRQIKEIAITRQVKALRTLARENPLRSAEINMDTMQSRLNRAKAKADEGEFVKVEEALQQFEGLRRFGEEISQIAKGLGYGAVSVDEINARATSTQLEVLSTIYGKVSEETKGAVEEAMEVSVEGHREAVKGLQDEGALNDIPGEPSIPDEIPVKVREKISKPESSGPVNGHEEAGTGSEEPSDGSKEPGNGSEESANGSEEPGNGTGGSGNGRR